MTRFTDAFGKYDSAPICAHGSHECDSATFCEGCEGQVYCDEHLWECNGCRKLFCEKHAKLTKTDCGMLCEACVPDYAPIAPRPRVPISVAMIGNGLYWRVGRPRCCSAY
jgi:hypothetical protein